MAGKQQGIIKGETASGLYYEGLRILKEKKPKYSIIENVKNLTSKKFKNQFEQILKDLNESGYNTYWKVLNAKDYGVPQNRKRIFIISIRKDIDNNKFEFPEPLELNYIMYEFLEDLVDSKYILSDKMFAYVLDLNEKQKGTKWEDRANNDFINPKIAHTLSVRGIKGQRAGVSNIICTKTKNEIKVINYKTNLHNKTNDKNLRNLTEKECFRLMGFNDKDYYILKDNKISNSQIYKMAGNSIVVNVLEEIFNKLLK